jgi:hypothetical protein
MSPHQTLWVSGMHAGETCAAYGEGWEHLSWSCKAAHTQPRNSSQSDVSVPLNDSCASDRHTLSTSGMHAHSVCAAVGVTLERVGDLGGSCFCDWQR